MFFYVFVFIFFYYQVVSMSKWVRYVAPFASYAAKRGMRKLGRYALDTLKRKYTLGKRKRPTGGRKRPSYDRFAAVMAARSGRRVYQSKKRRRYNPVKQLPKRYRKGVRKMIQDSQNKHMNHHKEIDTGSITWLANQCHYASWSVASEVNKTAYFNLSYEHVKDALGNNTMVVNEGDVTRTIKFVDWVMYINLRNNGNIPVKAHVWDMTCIADTNDTPVEIMNAYCAAIDDGGYAQADPRYFLWDAPQIKKHYAVHGYRKVMMNAGDELDLKIRRGPFHYRLMEQTVPNPQNSYRKGFKIQVVKFEGVTSHDRDNPALVGLGDGRIDWVMRESVVTETSASNKLTKLVEKAGDFDNLANPVVYGPAVEEIEEDA